MELIRFKDAILAGILDAIRKLSSMLEDFEIGKVQMYTTASELQEMKTLILRLKDAAEARYKELGINKR